MTMQRVTILCFVALLAVVPVRADEHTEIALWPNGLPKDAVPVESSRIEELKAKQKKGGHILFVERPSVTIYPAAKDKANGCGIVICPGGGYNILAWQHEGVELAEWMNSIGISAFILKYRVPRRQPRIHWEPLQDAQRAIRIVRHRAAEWGVDPNRLGVLGFSAGGHLTVMAGTHYEEKTYEPADDIDRVSARPDFLCPIYAAYLADGYRDDRAEIGSLVKITEDTPPTFMAVTLDDVFRGVQAGLLLAHFKQAGVPAEAHIYASGGHGYGIRDTKRPVSTWHHRLHEWLESSKMLSRDDH